MPVHCAANRVSAARALLALFANLNDAIVTFSFALAVFDDGARERFNRILSAFYICIFSRRLHFGSRGNGNMPTVVRNYMSVLCLNAPISAHCSECAGCGQLYRCGYVRD